MGFEGSVEIIDIFIAGAVGMDHESRFAVDII